MKTIEVNTRETLDELYNNSALTIEGLSKESISDFLDWIKSNAGLKSETAYVISGAFMNKSYGLFGNKAYPDDLTIVSVKLDDIIEPSKIMLKRFSFDGRWFDDIVDNNARN